jgi:hypothetical protein
MKPGHMHSLKNKPIVSLWSVNTITAHTPQPCSTGLMRGATGLGTAVYARINDTDVDGKLTGVNAWIICLRTPPKRTQSC